MRYLIGLGNPGAQYQNNRHNVGHMFIDFLQKNLKGGKDKAEDEVVLKKTDTFMNQSGSFVKKASVTESSDLVIVHDDLDIPFGKFKIQFGTGPKIHNGILSIEDTLGTNEFWRIRIGVDNPTTRLRVPENARSKMNGEDYVLQDFTEEELIELQNVFERIREQLKI